MGRLPLFPVPRPVRLLLAAALALAAIASLPGLAHGTTFDVYLEDFTGNPETAEIAYVRMYVELESPGIDLQSCTIGSAAAGWWAGTPMCFMDGPSVILEAYDHRAVTVGDHVEYPLQNGRLFTITSNKAAVAIDRIYFWRIGEIGGQYPNLYPDPVALTDFSGASCTFSADPSPVAGSSWGRVKAIYR
jgi:hypothetical protein